MLLASWGELDELETPVLLPTMVLLETTGVLPGQYMPACALAAMRLSQ